MDLGNLNFYHNDTKQIKYILDKNEMLRNIKDVKLQSKVDEINAIYIDDEKYKVTEIYKTNNVESDIWIVKSDKNTLVMKVKIIPEDRKNGILYGLNEVGFNMSKYKFGFFQYMRFVETDAPIENILKNDTIENIRSDKLTLEKIYKLLISSELEEMIKNIRSTKLKSKLINEYSKMLGTSEKHSNMGFSKFRYFGITPKYDGSLNGYFKKMSKDPNKISDRDSSVIAILTQILTAIYIINVHKQFAHMDIIPGNIFYMKTATDDECDIIDFQTNGNVVFKVAIHDLFILADFGNSTYYRLGMSGGGKTNDIVGYMENVAIQEIMLNKKLLDFYGRYFKDTFSEKKVKLIVQSFMEDKRRLIVLDVWMFMNMLIIQLGRYGISVSAKITNILNMINKTATFDITSGALEKNKIQTSIKKIMSDIPKIMGFK